MKEINLDFTDRLPMEGWKFMVSQAAQSFAEINMAVTTLR